MNRQDLEGKSREELIGVAEGLGLPRPRVLTQPELIDEILKRTTTSAHERARARGWLGKARDLLARVVERGLHLPDAARALRSDERGWPTPPPPLPTVTLAEIYAAQGHLERALAVLEEVLVREPDHAEAIRLRGSFTEQLGGKRPAQSSRPAPARAAPPVAAPRAAPHAAPPATTPAAPVAVAHAAPAPAAHAAPVAAAHAAPAPAAHAAPAAAAHAAPAPAAHAAPVAAAHAAPAPAAHAAPVAAAHAAPAPAAHAAPVAAAKSPAAPPMATVAAPVAVPQATPVHVVAGPSHVAGPVPSAVPARAAGPANAIAAEPPVAAEPPAAAEAPVAAAAVAPVAAAAVEEAPETLPDRYDVDEIVGIASDPTTVYLYWEVRPTSLARARARQPSGWLALRVVSVAPSWDGPVTETRDVRIDELYGDRFVDQLRPGSNVRVSIGWLSPGASGGGHFEPFAVGVEVTAPHLAPAPAGAPVVARWTAEGAPASAQAGARAYAGPPGGAASAAGATFGGGPRAALLAYFPENLSGGVAGLGGRPLAVPHELRRVAVAAMPAGAVPTAGGGWTAVREEDVVSFRRVGASELVREARKVTTVLHGGAGGPWYGGASELSRGGASELSRSGAGAASGAPHARP